MVYSGIVVYFRQPPPAGYVLVLGALRILMGVLVVFECLRSFSGAGGGARTRMAKALSYSVILVLGVHWLLESFIERRDEFWAFLIFFGVFSIAFVLFFSIMNARGYRWFRKEP